MFYNESKKAIYYIQHRGKSERTCFKLILSKYISAVYLLNNPSSNKINIFCHIRVLWGVRPHYLCPSQNFWGVGLLKLQFQNAAMASKMVPWALKPRNIEPRKIWAQSDNQKTFKTHFEVYFSCLFTLLLVNSNQKSK